MDVPANGWASRSNGWMFLTNGWVSRSNGWTFLSNGWASRSNGWMLLPNGWASHSNGWTFLSNGWSSRSNGCKFFWTDDPGRSNECKFLSNSFQTGSKRNSVRKQKAVIARFRVKGHILQVLTYYHYYGSPPSLEQGERRDEVLDQETMFSQLAKPSSSVVVSA